MASRGSSWQRRNEAAQAKGYRNYYDYRVHNYGRLPASAPPASGADRARLRGHRSRADLLRKIGPGDLISVAGGQRDRETGQYRWVEILVIDAEGREWLFRLRGDQLTGPELERFVSDLEQTGVVFSPSPSLDLRRYLPEEEPSAFGFQRAATGRWLVGFDSFGRAVTSPSVGRALTVATRADAERFHQARLAHYTGRSRFAVEEIG